MATSFLNYFENEMNYLVEETKEFKTNLLPNMESFDFAANSTDPDIKKLLEGVAFLNANLHQRIDQKNLELNQDILNSIYPAFNRPIPSFCVFQIPDVSKRLIIPKKTKISTIANKTSYSFYSTHDIKLSGLNIINISNINANTLPKEIQNITNSVIEIEIQKKFDVMEDEIVFYINTQNNTHETIYELIHTFYIEKNTPVFEHGNQIGEIIPIDELEILQTKPNESSAYHPLIEYKIFPHKFMFFKIKLSKLPKKHLHIPIKHKNIKLDINKNTFLLNCLVGVNLIDMPSDPILIDHTQHRYRLIMPKNHDLYELKSIHNTNPVKYKYIEYFSLQYNSRTHQDILWSLKEESSHRRTKYLYFYNNQIEEQVIFAKMSCTQTNANDDIMEHSKFEITDFGLQCTNLHKPTKHKPKNHQVQAQKTLISHLFLNYFGLDSSEMLFKLKELFDIYSVENLNFDELIKDIQIETRIVPFKNNMVPKMDVLLKVEDSPKVFLLSKIIARILVNNINMNTKITLIIKKNTTNEVVKICHLI